MGFFGFFNRKSADAPISAKIDVTESCITINGRTVVLPCNICELSDILGKPRSCGTLAVWDKSGIYCYKEGINKVCCIVVCLAFTNPHNRACPSNLFSGNVTVGGKPWTDFAENGEDILLAKLAYIGKYSLSFVYKVYDNIKEIPETEEFTDIEIQIKQR